MSVWWQVASERLALILARLAIAVAVAGCPVIWQCVLDDGGGTAYAGLYGDCFNGTVECAGTAFHACISVGYEGFFVIDSKDPVRADNLAHAAADALVGIQTESDNVFQICLSIHIDELI